MQNSSPDLLPSHHSYVDQGKNPHTYTREFIERVAGENMYTNGILSAVTVSLLTSYYPPSYP